MIPPEPEPIPTILEFGKVKNIITFEQSFSEIDEQLGGSLRESFLVNDRKIPSIENSEALWKLQQTRWEIFYSSGDQVAKYYPWDRNITVCIDGILVAGPPGRPHYHKEVRRLRRHSSLIGTHGAALIDVRGELKPEITPARTRPESLAMELPGWQRLRRDVNIASGRIWAKITDYLMKGMTHEKFWKLGEIYSAWFPNIPHQKLWEYVAISLVGADKNRKWWKIKDLGKLMLEDGKRGLQLVTENGERIGSYKSLEEWARAGRDSSDLSWKMNALVLLMCSAMVEDGCVKLQPEYPTAILAEYSIYNILGGISAFLIPFIGRAAGALTLQSHCPLANRKHPLSRVYLESRFLAKKTDIQEFASSFVPCIAETISLRGDKTSLEKPGRWLKHAAHRYFAVNWSNYRDDLKPPYRIWLQDKEWTLISTDDFKRWSQ